MKHYQTQAALLKALAHPVRLAILDVLRRREACVCHLEARSASARPTSPSS
jgi:DNA-binding transcriptional ArsR family regulator